MSRQSLYLEEFEHLFKITLFEQEKRFIEYFDSESFVKYFSEYFEGDFIKSAELPANNKNVIIGAVFCLLQKIKDRIIEDFKFKYDLNNEAMFSKGIIKWYNEELFELQTITSLDIADEPFSYREIEHLIKDSGRDIIRILYQLGKIKNRPPKIKELDPESKAIFERTIKENISLYDACRDPNGYANHTRYDRLTHIITRHKYDNQIIKLHLQARDRKKKKI